MNDSSANLRRIVVSGANKGIGRAIVERMLEEHDDVSVFLGSRSLDRGQAARDELLEAHPEWKGRLEVLELDVTDDVSVRAAAERVGAPLYGLVNNAGIGFGDADMARVLDVNVRGVHRMCEAFVPLLDAHEGRVVNVTSAAGPNFVSSCSEARQAFFLDDGHSWAELEAFMEACVSYGDKAAFEAEGMGSDNAYGLSKACANTYTLMLARQHPDLKINACTPGFIATDLTAHYAQAQGKAPEDLGMKTPREGATAPLYLLFGQLDGNGRYYGSDAVRSPLHKYRSPGDPPFEG